MAVFPSSEKAIDKLSNDELRANYRIINDCSLLSPHCEPTVGYLSPLQESMESLHNDCLVSIFDLSNSYHQCNLDDSKIWPDTQHCTRDLFSFYSFIPGVDYLRNCKLPMGFKNLSSLASFLFKRIIETVNLMPA